MAVELATGYISLVPTTRGMRRRLQTEFDPLEREGANVGDRTARSFGRTFTAGVATAATRGAVALAAGFTLVGAAGIKVAADFEQTQIAFEGILGSASEATGLLNELRAFANVTPFQFTDLTKSSQQLLAVGFAADTLIPTMRTLGNVAAGLGAGPDAIESTVRALGQIKGKGKAASQELIQISEALPGFSAIGAIAEGLGVTVGEAFKLVEQGAVPADQAISLILAGMEKFPGAAGAMERQSKTLNGVISTFKDTLATTAIDFITPYLPATSSAVASFGGFISNELVPGIQSVIDIFGEEGAGGIFSRLGAIIATNAPIIGQKLLDLGGELVAWIEPQIPGMLEALAGFLGAAAVWILEDGAPMLAAATIDLTAALVDWVLTDALPGLIDALPDMLAALTEWIATEAVPAVVRGGKDMGAALAKGFYEGLVDAFMPDQSTMDLHIPGTDIDIPVPVLDDGGIVPGRRGDPTLVLAHAGETVFPTHKAPLSAFAVAGAGMPAAGGAGGGPLIGSLSVVQMPGEDAVSAAMRELKRVQLLSAA